MLSLVKRTVVVSLVSWIIFSSSAAWAGGSGNLYWPGGFESHLFGGIYSNNKFVTLTDKANHTVNGIRSWEVHAGYQHLELIIPCEKDYRLSFWAKNDRPYTIIMKNIGPGEKDSSGKVMPVEEHIPIHISVNKEWKKYSLKFNTGVAYPGPVTDEILISIFLPENEVAYIDDLSVVPLSPLEDEDLEAIARPVELLVNPDFEKGAVGWSRVDHADPGAIRTEDFHTSEAETGVNHFLLLAATSEGHSSDRIGQVFSAESLAGKSLLIACDAGFLTMDYPGFAWSGIVIDLLDGASPDAPPIRPEPWPFWYPLCKAQPPGTLERIEAVFQIPEDASELMLVFKLGSRVGLNKALIDNIRMGILEAR